MRLLVPVAWLFIACSGVSERSEPDFAADEPSCSIVIDDTGVCVVVLHDGADGTDPLDEMGVCPLSCE